MEEGWPGSCVREEMEGKLFELELWTFFKILQLAAALMRGNYNTSEWEMVGMIK